MTQTGVTVEILQLSKHLIALEAASHGISKADTCPVCEKLRRHLGTSIGTAGFSSLLSRALTMAEREAPGLSVVQVAADGSMEGLEREVSPLVAAYLLSLLITFIGDTLTMRLLHDIWPDLRGPQPCPGRK